MGYFPSSLKKDVNCRLYKFSGGGSYDKRGIKVGKWIELSDGSYKYS